jgi:phage tail P2-like protein
MSNSLLPLNATPAEHALAEAVARVSDVAIPIKDLYRPDAVPASLLPWLAWALSVDEWNPSWTEPQKRAAVANSFYIQSHKGTVAAMRTALNALGFVIEILEWFERTPLGDPYTFGLVLTVEDTGPGIPDASGWTTMEAVALRTKNVRSHLTGIDATLIAHGGMYHAARAYMGETIFVDHE